MSIRNRVSALAWSAGIFFALPARAHEKFFVDEGTRGDIPAFFRELRWDTASAAVMGFAAVALAVAVDRRRRPLPAKYAAALASWAPTVLGIAMGASLFAAALGRTLFAPNLELPDGALGTAVVVAELAIGGLLVLGLFARPAATALLVLCAASFFWFGLAALDYLNYVGIAFFLLVWGRGRLSLGSVFSRVFLAVDAGHVKPVAVVLLQVATGAAFVILAVGKVLRPDLHFRLLEMYPGWNPYEALHRLLPFLTREWYLLGLALIEGFGGLALATGALLRPMAAAILIPFLLSPWFFGAWENLWHLPVIGTLVALFLLGKEARKG